MNPGPCPRVSGVRSALCRSRCNVALMPPWPQVRGPEPGGTPRLARSARLPRCRGPATDAEDSPRYCSPACRISNSPAIHQRPYARQVLGRQDRIFAVVGMNDHRVARLAGVVRHEAEAAEFVSL